MLGLAQVDLNQTTFAKENEWLRRYYREFHEDKKQQVVGFVDLFNRPDDDTIAQIRQTGKQIWFITWMQIPIGFVTFGAQMPPYTNCLAIYDFFVESAYRGQGLGRRALNLITRRLFALYPAAQRIGLAVFAGPHAAKHLYTTEGFTTNLEVMLLERGTPRVCVTTPMAITLAPYDTITPGE